MYIKHILVNDFRMLVSKKYEFNRNFNLIYGKNAQGKTSLIEAVYFLASGKSFRTRKLAQLIKFERQKATLFSKIDGDSYAIALTQGKRDFFINSENVGYKNYLGNILAVSFAPEDIDLIVGSPDLRRRFFNYEISQVDREYLKTLLEFQKVLKVRNLLLKKNQAKDDIFSVYNEKYVELSLDLMEKRGSYAQNISKLLTAKYEELFGVAKKVELVYETVKFKTNDRKKELKEILDSKLEKDIIYGYTQIGPSKDDFDFLIEGKSAKSFASTGEKKSIIFTLKLAIGKYIESMKNTKPIYLFDDISAYFDEVREKRIIEYLKKEGVQCFFTSTKKLDICAHEIEMIEGDVFEE